MESVRKSAGGVMPLQNQHALAGLFCEQGGGRQAAYSRSNNDSVP
jgi:hypothetical protein